MNITFAKLSLPSSGTIVVGVMEGRSLSPSAQEIDAKTGGALARAMGADRFRGKRGEFLSVLAPSGIDAGRVLLAGLGKAKEIDIAGLEGLGGAIVAQLNAAGETQASVMVDDIKGAKPSGAKMAAAVAFGARLRAYRFDKYRTKEKPEERPTMKKLAVLVDGPSKAKDKYAECEKIADGVFFTRDLVSEPANILYPETLAAEAETLRALGVEVEVLGVPEMKKLGMGALLGVGQGSVRESRLIVMRWNGAAKADETPVAFVGKGVTFDTGGISIKPSAGMEDMKWDMGGSGVVLGLMKALAGRKAKANVVGVVGAVENMPSGSAQRPGDVVTTMSGQTIEVINTDAEGRLVLADALWYTQDRFKPKFMINLATLTGAIIVSLGSERAGMFCNNDQLSDRLMKAGDEVGEKLWPMPIDEAYDADIASDIADMKNVGAGRGAGSIAGAKLLERFVNKLPWAHLDIAGVTWSKKDKNTVPKGATAFGVRLLDRLVATHYES
ncbi:MAG: leucyl aminopeptidase [Rhodospirillaceae bacterium]|nr:leucyl aminopeptidase [Rhodospirillaceae bacterium]